MNGNSHKTARRILTVLAIVVCAVMFVTSVVAVAGSIVVGQSAKDGLDSAVLGIAQAVEAAQTGIASVSSTLTDVSSATQKVQSAAQQLGPSVSDKGLVATLLPDAQVERLTAAIATLKDTLATVQQALKSAASMYQAASKIPFIQLPTIPDDKLQGASDLIAQITTQLTQLTQAISDVRAGVSTAVGKVTTLVASLSDGISAALSLLNKVDARLSDVQAKLQVVRQQGPTWINAAMIVFVLFFTWVAGTQIYVIRQAWRYYKSIGATSEQAATGV
jgi:uncharacterized phage infection (PIP) family protein YhgE